MTFPWSGRPSLHWHMGCNSTNFLLALLPENQFLASASSSTRRPPEALQSSPLQPIGPKTPPSDEVGVASGFRRDLRGDELVQRHGGGHRPRPAHQLQVLAEFQNVTDMTQPNRSPVDR